MKNRLKRIIALGCLAISVMSVSAQINTERMILIGRNALYYDDYALSIQYFNQVIDAKPYLYEPYFFRGLAKFYLEDYTGAEEDCGQAIKLNPYYVNSYEVQGLSRINQKNYSGAIEDYKSLINLEQNNKNVWHNLVLCYLELDSLDAADSTIDSFIDKWPKYADGYLFKAEVLLNKKDTITAETFADKALEAEKYNVQALSLKGALLMYHEDYKGAEASYDEAIRLQPKNSRTIINRALCRYNQNNYRGAMSDYDLALDIDPGNFIGHYNRGLLRASVGEDNKAIEDFDFILEIDPNDVMTLFNRARLYDQTGDYKSAIRDYTKVIKEFPKFLYGYQLRADARRKIGDISGAMKDEEHILRENVAQRYGYSTPTSRQKNRTRKKSQIDPNDYQQLVEEDEQTKVYDDELRGKIQNKTVETKLLPIIVLTGDINTATENVLSEFTIDAYNISNEAIESFRQGIENCMLADEARLKVNSNTETNVQFSSSLTKDKPIKVTENNTPVINSYYSKAESAFSNAIEKSPQFAEAYYNRAYVRAMQGKYTEAIEDLTITLKKRPNISTAYYNRGIVYIFSGDKQHAISDLSKAGELGIYQAYSIIKHTSK